MPVAKNKANRKIHQNNNRLCDRSAKLHTFEAGDQAHLYNPAVKPWSGPFEITAKISDLNYKLLDHSNKKLIVHVNRLESASYSDTREVKPSRKRERRTRRRWPTRAERKVEEEGEIRIGSFLLVQPAQQQDDLELIILSDKILGTPDNQTRDTPNSERFDPTYAPATTPRSRPALQPTRGEPPITRLRARVTP